MPIPSIGTLHSEGVPFRWGLPAMSKPFTGLGPPQTPALRGANHIFNQGTPIVKTLPVTTNAGDCIVLAIWANLGTSAPSASGAGATWVTVATNSDTGPPGASNQYSLIVGYNCSAGQTTCTITLPGVTPGGAIPGSNVDCSVWSGIRSSANPVLSDVVAQVASGGTLTTSSIGYAANNLLVIAAATIANQTAALGTPVWGNGATNHRTNGGASYVAADYFISSSLPAGGGGATSTTLNETSGDATRPMSIVLAVLQNAP